MFEWTKGSAYTMICTLYGTNITLNNTAASYFEDIKWCLIGIDHESKKIAIKPVTKREIDLKIVDLQHLHKVSIGKGYGRISNKALMDEISKLLQKQLNGDKFTTNYDEHDKMLVVDLNSPI